MAEAGEEGAALLAGKSSEDALGTQEEPEIANLRLWWGLCYANAMGVCGIVLVALGSTLSDLAEDCGTTATAVGTVFIARGVGAITGALCSARLYAPPRSGNHVMVVVLLVLSAVLLYRPAERRSSEVGPDPSRRTFRGLCESGDAIRKRRRRSRGRTPGTAARRYMPFVSDVWVLHATWFGLGACTDGRAEILPVDPDFATHFRRTALSQSNAAKITRNGARAAEIRPASQVPRRSTRAARS